VLNPEARKFQRALVQLFNPLSTPGLYLRTAFSAKRSNVSQIFWVYVLRRKECGKYRIWNTVENLNS
jgi:hypothetical protein